MKLSVPKTVWLAFCRTCGSWLDEDTSAEYAADLARDEHPEHFEDEHVHDVRVIPFVRGPLYKWKRVTPRAKDQKR